MEDVKINLKFTKFIISKIITNIVKKKTGSTIKFEVKEVELRNKNGEVEFSLSVDGSMKEVDFDNLVSHL